MSSGYYDANVQPVERPDWSVRVSSVSFATVVRAAEIALATGEPVPLVELRDGVALRTEEVLPPIDMPDEGGTGGMPLLVGTLFREQYDPLNGGKAVADNSPLLLLRPRRLGSLAGRAGIKLVAETAPYREPDKGQFGPDTAAAA